MLMMTPDYLWTCCRAAAASPAYCNFVESLAESFREGGRTKRTEFRDREGPRRDRDGVDQGLARKGKMDGFLGWRGVAWRGVAWRGVAWRGVACACTLCAAALPARAGSCNRMALDQGNIYRLKVCMCVRARVLAHLSVCARALVLD